MHKVAIVLLAGTDGFESMGRMANALTAVKEFKDAGDDVQLIFDGAGVTWIGELAKPDHSYHGLFEEVRDTITGVCAYCAKAFKVTESIKEQVLPFADEYNGHPSFRNLIANGFHILNF